MPPTVLAPDRLITGEELAQMPDHDLCELVEGRIIPMSPTNWRHGDIEATLSYHLSRFVRDRKLGRVLTGEVGIYTGRDPDTVRGADVAFISTGRLAEVQSPSFLDVAPELVVEVMSPGNPWGEVQQKLEEYFGAGVERVWLVEPARRRVLVYRRATEAEVLEFGEMLRGEGVLDGFELAVSDVFEEA